MTRVLVVDDDGPTRDVLRTLLEDNDFAVSEAGDGDEAIHALRASRSSSCSTSTCRGSMASACCKLWPPIPRWRAVIA